MNGKGGDAAAVSGGDNSGSGSAAKGRPVDFAYTDSYSLNGERGLAYALVVGL